MATDQKYGIHQIFGAFWIVVGIACLVIGLVFSFSTDWPWIGILCAILAWWPCGSLGFKALQGAPQPPAEPMRLQDAYWKKFHVKLKNGNSLEITVQISFQGYGISDSIRNEIHGKILRNLNAEASLLDLIPDNPYEVDKLFFNPIIEPIRQNLKLTSLSIEALEVNVRQNFPISPTFSDSTRKS